MRNVQQYVNPVHSGKWGLGTSEVKMRGVEQILRERLPDRDKRSLVPPTAHIYVYIRCGNYNGQNWTRTTCFCSGQY